MGIQHSSCYGNRVVVKGEGNPNDVLPPMAGRNPNKKTLVLDLDGTLVHSSWTPMPAGYHFTITLEGYEEPVYVLKRPGVDELLQQLGGTGLYEIVVFTAAPKVYAEAVVEKLLESLPVTSDSTHFNGNRNIIPSSNRLASSYCKRVEGVLDDVKDLSLLGRDLKNVIFVDDRSTSYHLQPQNAIPINSWVGDDFEDKSLFEILSFCLKNSQATTDVRKLISYYIGFDKQDHRLSLISII